MKGSHPADPRGLIEEAYKINAITEAECRTIFFDWLFGIKDGEEPLRLVAALHEHFAPAHPGHPMTDLLAEGLASESRRDGLPRRKGRRGRI